MSNKLRQALAILSNGTVLLINQTALAADALELEYLIEFELTEVLSELLENTKPNDYSGNRPPKRSYVDEISGLDLFAFVVEIKRFSNPVYYKFSISGDVLWLVSYIKIRIIRRCHE